MKALTIRQPWPWLILHGGKCIENRTWPTRYRGPLAIHAAASMTRAEWYAALMFIRERGIKPPIEVGYEIPMRDELELGAIIGTVEVVDCVTASPSPWFTGPYGLVLRNPVALTRPIPAKGKLGLWNWEGEANA